MENEFSSMTIMKHREELKSIGIASSKRILWNLSELKLVTQTKSRQQGAITSSGALACDTGEFTGR